MNNVNQLIKTWNKEAKSYIFERDKQVDFLADCYHAIKCLGKVKGKELLEVGSGSGQVSAYLATKGGKISLLDISTSSLEFSRRYFDAKKIPLKIYKQNAFRMKFRNNSFDCVWNSGVIEHFSDDKKVEMIIKMWKLVKPGGRLLISAPSAHDYMFMIAKKILQLRRKWAFGFEDDLTTNRLKKLAKQAGLKSFKTYSYNPVVGIWFFPYGREITNILGLNKFKFHKKFSPFGHVVVLCARKPLKQI